MRTIKELLILLREFLPGNINTDDGGCICWTILCMEGNNIISHDEADLLHDHIINNTPEKPGMFFWWPAGELAPRLEFLDKLIAEL